MQAPGKCCAQYILRMDHEPLVESKLLCYMSTRSLTKLCCAAAVMVLVVFGIIAVHQFGGKRLLL